MTENSTDAFFFHESEAADFLADSHSLYPFAVKIGQQQFQLDQGDCCYTIDKKNAAAQVFSGAQEINSTSCATIIRGYNPPEATISLLGDTTLPYINGCSVKQIFPPIRSGDPTLQFLHIPPNTSEQAHHIHSTYRVAYVLSGSGRCILGSAGHTTSHILEPGTICILKPMCAHHFETDNEPLQVLPLHVFSSVGTTELNHPMFLGTKPI